MRARRQSVLAGSLLWFAALTSFVPFIAIILTSLQQPGSTVSGFVLPVNPYFSNYADAWTAGGFASLIQSSAIIALTVMPLGVLCATLAGYAMGTMTFRGKSVVLAAFLLGLTLPYETIVIALYYGFRDIHLLDTYWALILPLTGAFMPFGIIWMRSHFETVPKSLMEAAQIDGANSWTTFWRILVPTARPAISTLALLYFVWSWNQFLFALILIQDPTHRTAPSGLNVFVTQFGKNLPLLSAATVIVIVPVVIVYLVFQRQLLRGFLQGAVKE